MDNVAILMVIAGVLLAYVALINLFVAAMHAKRVIDRGTQIHGLFLYPLYVGAGIAVLLDVAFNATAGTVMFRELPREALFTERCRRHKKAKSGWRKLRAQWWCRQLNKFDKGHC